MYLKLLSTLFVVTGFLFANGQKAAIDSLLETTSDLYRKQPAKTINIADSALVLSKTINYTLGIAASYLERGKGHYGSRNYSLAFEDLDKAARYVAEKHQSLLSNVELTGNTGLGVYPSREHYLVFVPISEEQIAIVDLIRQGRDIPSILARNATIIRHELDAIASKGKK